MRFARHFSVFLASGVPILDALAIIRNDASDTTLKRVLFEVANSLRSGTNLPAALAAHSYAFPAFFPSMLRAADATGDLEAAFAQTADYLQRDIAAKKKIQAALSYPLIVSCLAAISAAVLIEYVLPRFKTFFSDFRVPLPLPTRILVSVANVLTNSAILTTAAVVVAGIVLAVIGVSQIALGRRLIDTFLLRVPLIGVILRYSAIERFCRILSALVESGVALPEAIRLAAAGTNNHCFEPRLLAARTAMIQGSGVSLPLARTRMFPQAAISMIRVGEETGTLDGRLEEVAEFYASELDDKLKTLTNLLEPVAIVAVGLVVGFVALALVSAIYGVYQHVNVR